MELAKEYHVNIMAACHVMGMWLVYLGVRKNRAPFLCEVYGVAKETTEHEAYNTGGTFGPVIHTASQKYKVIALSETLRHPSLCFARWQAAQRCQLLQCAVRQGPHVPVQCTAVNITYLPSIFRKAAEDVFLWIAGMCQM